MENKNNVVNTNNAETHKIPVVSLDTISLAHKIYKKFGDNPEAIKGVGEIIDMMKIKDNCIVLELPDDSESEDIVSTPPITSANDATLNNEYTDWVAIFNSELNLDSLNEMIEEYESNSDDTPYLVMNYNTLRVFEEMTNMVDELNCDEVDVHECAQTVDCADCEYCNDEADMVYIEHDSERNTINACYIHNDEEYTITIDNNLAFGVVKVR